MVESIVQMHASNTPVYNHCQVLAAMPNCMHCAFIQQHAHLQQHHHQREKYLALLHYDSYCNVRWLIFFSLFFFSPIITFWDYCCNQSLTEMSLGCGHLHSYVLFTDLLTLDMASGFAYEADDLSFTIFLHLSHPNIVVSYLIFLYTVTAMICNRTVIDNSFYL